MTIPRFRTRTIDDIWQRIFNPGHSAIQVTDEVMDNTRTGQGTDPLLGDIFPPTAAQDNVVGDGAQTNKVLVAVAADKVGLVKSIMFSADQALTFTIKFRDTVANVDGDRILSLVMPSGGVVSKDFSFGEIARGKKGESVVITYTPAANVKMNVRGIVRNAPETTPA